MATAYGEEKCNYNQRRRIEVQVRIHPKHRYTARLLAKVLKVGGYKFEFVYRQESYDKDLTELAFLNQNLHLFDEKVEAFRERVLKAIENASKN